LRIGFFDGLGQFGSEDQRHSDVDDKKIETVAIEQFITGKAVGGRSRFDSLALEDLDQEPAKNFIIVDYQYMHAQALIE
jgi:hypothetical protein